MTKHFLRAACVAVAMATASIAYAGQGTPPLPGIENALPDNQWLLGLANGVNSTAQSGLTAAGTNQATALQLGSGVRLMEVDTAASGTGVALPACVGGTQVSLYNNGANTLTVYPAIANNALTGAQDTINNGTSLSGGMATHTAEYFFCAKNGVWAAK